MTSAPPMGRTRTRSSLGCSTRSRRWVHTHTHTHVFFQHRVIVSATKQHLRLLLRVLSWLLLWLWWLLLLKLETPPGPTRTAPRVKGEGTTRNNPSYCTPLLLPLAAHFVLVLSRTRPNPASSPPFSPHSLTPTLPQPSFPRKYDE